MKKKTVLAFVLLVPGLCLTVVFLTKRQERAKVCFSENCFFVELARTPAEQERGLMFKRDLAQNEGLLFVFDQEEPHSFWMKNVLIPLDIIWLDKAGKVVFISPNALPCLSMNCPIINPEQKAKYVLELGGGLAQKIGLSIGRQMDLKIP